LLVSDPLCFKEAVKKPELCKAKEEELRAIKKKS